MEFKKDIKFTEKKVDESWKESINVEKDGKEYIKKDEKKGERKTGEKEKKDKKNEKTNEKVPLKFSSFVTSIGMQALLHMGDIPNPMTQKKEVNLEAAAEIIDILAILQDKTKGNLDNEESKLLNSLLYDLQLAYVKKMKE